MAMMRQNQQNSAQWSGVLLLDKPENISSNKALGKVKSLMEIRKAGHTGSLDPIATGLLPVCFGESTKIAGFFLDAAKRYRTRIKLGESTNTGDREGVVTSRAAVDVSDREIQKVLKQFEGDISQVPPMHSAVKVNGEPLYKYARKGIEVERKARQVTVYEIALLKRADAYIDIDLRSSSGFYVRVLAHELGEKLGCGAHVDSLKRLSVGHLQLDDAYTVEQIEALPTVEERRRLLVPSDETLIDLPKISLSLDAAYYLCQGHAVRAQDLPMQGMVRLYDNCEDFLGIGTSLGDGRVAPKRMFLRDKSAA